MKGFLYPATAKRSIGALMLVFTILGCEPLPPESAASISESPRQSIKEVKEDWEQIRKRGTLRAILTYSSSSYFIYRGQPLGYEYELVSRLADHLGLELEIVVADDMDQMTQMLLRGEGDLIAHGLTITKARKDSLAFTYYHNLTEQVLVQRKPNNWRQLKQHEIDRRLVRSPIDLIGQNVHVRKGSAYYHRLHHLMDELGDTIYVKSVPGNNTTDEIIGKVANGEINYTIADENIALINATYYHDLDVETPISLPQKLGWALRKSSPVLLIKINEWIGMMKGETDYYVIYNKYFKNKRAYKARMESEYFSKSGGKISPYDDFLQQYADDIEWDWRLLAALVYQESRFDPETESWAGARGLMQVMPATAESYGITQLYNPEENIRAGINYIRFLERSWQTIPDSTERIRFILASYNAGLGHVQDAQRLAEKHGKDPLKWEGHVAEFLLLKSKPDYFNDEVVRHGYCRGNEPYEYVIKILDRYEQYQHHISLG